MGLLMGRLISDLMGGITGLKGRKCQETARLSVLVLWLSSLSVYV